MIGAVLLGYNVINILASALATEVITKAIPGAWGVAVATGLMTVLVLVFVEVLPKTLAIVRADDVARALSAPMLVVVWLFGPVIGCDPVGRPPDVCACSASTWTWRPTCWPPTRRSAARSKYHHSEGLVESRDRRMLGGRAGPGGHGRLRDHGPPQVDIDARRRPAAARAGRQGAGADAHPPAALPRRTGEHRRRAARQGPAARPGRRPRARPTPWTSPPSCASPGSSPTPPT